MPSVWAIIVDKMIAVWAIAHKMIQEAIRRRTPVILLVFWSLLIVGLPFLLRSDGTLKGHVQLTLSYSLNLTFVILALMTLFLGTLSFTNEIKYKHIYMLDTKSLSRWQFFVGKIVGLALLNLAFLVIMASVIRLMLFLVIAYDDRPQERARVFQEIMTCYRGCSPYWDNAKLEKQVVKEYERIKNRPEFSDRSEQQLKERLAKSIKARKNLIPYRYRQQWRFEEVPVQLAEQDGQQLKMRYKIFSSKRSNYGALCKVRWEIGSTRKYIFEDQVKTGEFIELAIPAQVIDENNTVQVSFFNQDPAAGFIFFPINDGLELFYPVGTFWDNYLRGILLLFILLCFLSIIAMFAATFLTFPVAILLALFVILMGLVADSLADTVFMGLRLLFKGYRDTWYYPILHYLFYYILDFLFVLIPGFSEYEPVQYISLGRIIEWNLVFHGILYLLILRGGILTICGCAIFYYREIGKPVE